MLIILSTLISRVIFRRAAREDLVGVLARAALVLVAAGAVFLIDAGHSKRDLAFERQALDARGLELLARAANPGSPLACLDGGGGEMVETSCERVLFASPETTAAAISYVSAQLALLADYGSLSRRAGMVEPASLINLRHPIEADRFGLVAQVLLTRDGCTPSQCQAFALLNDTSRIRANLVERPFDHYLARYAGGWPTVPTPSSGASEMAGLSPPGLGVVGAVGLIPAEPDAAPAAAASGSARGIRSVSRVPRNDIFLPSAASIPPISIMDAEPPVPAAAEPKTAATSAGKGASTTRTAPAPAAKQSSAPAHKPVSPLEQARPATDLTLSGPATQ